MVKSPDVFEAEVFEAEVFEAEVFEAEVFEACLRGPETAEALRAFAEKRPPAFD